MIQSWRANFNAPDAYFGFVQLSTWCGAGLPLALGQMRDAQLVASSTLAKVGYGTNADHGAVCNIHPPQKQNCARRLADSALALQYGQAIAWQSPTYASAAAGGALGSLTVSLKDVPSAGLATIPIPYNILNNNGVNCTALDAQYGANTCAGAALQFDDAGASWVAATVALDASAQKIVLTAPPPAGATKVVASAYGYGAIPLMTVYAADRDLPVLTWNRSVA